METISLIVRNLVFLVMLAMFMEMLLPLQGTRRFVQVIIGLFVVLAVLGPVVTLFGQQPPLSFALPVDIKEAELRTILDQGQEMQEVTSSQEQDTYIRRLEEQIEVMCRLVPGVEEAVASVLLSPSTAGSPGMVEKVLIEIQYGDRQVVDPVTDIQIGGAQIDDAQIDSAPEAEADTLATEQEIAGQVRETVAGLFGLQEEQVIVNFVNPR